jgi:hypothetical protein
MSKVMFQDTGLIHRHVSLDVFIKFFDEKEMERTDGVFIGTDDDVCWERLKFI